MRKLVLLITLFVFLYSGSPILADSPRVEVNHIANVFEKLQERAILFLKFSNNDKLDFQNFLLEKRLAEIKYVIDSKNWDGIEQTSSRYATYLGQFSDFAVKNNSGDKKDDILNMFERHSKILEELQRNFEYDSAWWLLLQHDINSLKIFTEQIKSL